MLMPPVLSSRLPTGTFFPCAQAGRSLSSAGTAAAPPAAAVRRKSRRFSGLLIACPQSPVGLEVKSSPSLEVVEPLTSLLHECQAPVFSTRVVVMSTPDSSSPLLRRRAARLTSREVWRYVSAAPICPRRRAR